MTLFIHSSTARISVVEWKRVECLLASGSRVRVEQKKKHWVNEEQKKVNWGCYKKSQHIFIINELTSVNSLDIEQLSRSAVSLFFFRGGDEKLLMTK